MAYRSLRTFRISLRLSLLYMDVPVNSHNSKYRRARSIGDGTFVNPYVDTPMLLPSNSSVFGTRISTSVAIAAGSVTGGADNRHTCVCITCSCTKCGMQLLQIKWPRYFMRGCR